MKPDYDRIPAMLAQGMVGKQICSALGVSHSTISRQTQKRGVDVGRPRLRSIKAVLASGPATTREIADRTRANSRAIASRLNQLAHHGVVEKSWVQSRYGFKCVWRLREGVAP